jgi:hypothetical protein
MPCCLVVLLGLLLPRVTMIFIWLFTNWFAMTFKSYIVPVLGFLFMPYTTLAWMGAMLTNNYTLDIPWLIVLVVAIVVDVGNWGGVHIGRRRWRAR